MNQAPPNDRRPEAHAAPSYEADSGNDETKSSFKETVETAAKAYFGACRKIARAINRLKKG
ncbi:hypothetical protein FIV42_08355 [Persicimonas caeni]|uniref:Uncharacterized protein n=1 Tax=Persicimonas caeni TaxID=2292766 RepID=A0A4Y6PR65_PERCE|nr:hypothetical protein [Persicimonas caeni]QDG50740.1 hypothetical protein FIV42_08355 [Persicimonas caeni]QED31961.1 hypothetical protein FRD00_08350 [Persicimonas caeni]